MVVAAPAHAPAAHSICTAQEPAASPPFRGISHMSPLIRTTTTYNSVASGWPRPPPRPSAPNDNEDTASTSTSAMPCHHLHDHISRGTIIVNHTPPVPSSSNDDDLASHWPLFSLHIRHFAIICTTILIITTRQRAAHLRRCGFAFHAARLSSTSLRPDPSISRGRRHFLLFGAASTCTTTCSRLIYYHYLLRHPLEPF